MPWAGVELGLKRGARPHRRLNGRVTNEVCHFRSAYSTSSPEPDRGNSAESDRHMCWNETEPMAPCRPEEPGCHGCDNGLLRRRCQWPTIAVMIPQPKDANAIRQEIAQVWGGSLSLLSDVINQAEASILTCEDCCTVGNGLGRLISMGAASIRQTRAGLSLCHTGFADEAFSFCRSLWEKRVDIAFILLSGDPATTLDRYHDWDWVRALDLALKDKSEWDKLGWGHIGGWDEVRQERDGILAKYDEHERTSVGKRDRWAKLARDLGGYHNGAVLDAFEDRSIAVGVDQADSRFFWMLCNGSVHMSPRGIRNSFSVPPASAIATGATSFGLDMPIVNLACRIYEVALRFEVDLPADVVPEERRISLEEIARTRRATVGRLVSIVEAVPTKLRARGSL